jgi:hypothetical protein
LSYHDKRKQELVEKEIYLESGSTVACHSESTMTREQIFSCMEKGKEIWSGAFNDEETEWEDYVLAMWSAQPNLLLESQVS